MARKFDTEFDYNDETYKATVVITGGNEDKTVMVKVPEELEDIVPDGKIVVEHFNEEKKETKGLSKDPALTESIIAAVEKHEDAEPPFGEGSIWS